MQHTRQQSAVDTDRESEKRAIHSRATQSVDVARPVATKKSWLRRIVMARLESLNEGRLTIVDESGNLTTVGRPSPKVADARIQVRDADFFRHVVFGGSLGAAESYLRGQWETDDLVALIRLFAVNYEAASSLNSWASAITQKIAQFGYWLQRNTRSGSRKNIAAHYDLGNDFYELFLDSTMTYSSAVFDHTPGLESVSQAKSSSFSRSSSMAEIGLREAQLEKYDRICRKLQLCESDRVVEVGCGWGGFAIHAVTNYGCHVTATTISDEQFGYAQQRINELGLADRIDLVQTDYRDLCGTYDKLVSIEMIEAVGYENLSTYFAKCASLLKPNGLMTIQAITMPDHRFATYRCSVDFIQRYVFPGGFLPSLGAIQESISTATDLRIVGTEEFAEHYAETLSRWSERFEANLAKVRQLECLSTHDIDRFIRLWRYYFAYCEAGFRQQMIGLMQLTMQRRDSGSGCRESGTAVS